ncbi:MAG: HD domain-containing phosphohydrolase, partial [Proteocatella sp.]
KKVGEILKTHCRADDIIARLGGDEFAIILPKTDDIETNLIMNRITEATTKENLNSIMVSVAIGHSIKIAPIQDINDIIRISENNMYKNKIKTGKLMRKKTFELIINTLNSRYSHEQIHNNSVSDLCQKLGEVLDFSKEQLNSLSDAALYHDIGKIIIPPEILNKAFPLSSEERELVQRHPETGYQILKSIEEYSHLARYVLSHHEHWDGNGYPRRQKGSEIPMFSRIICIADAYEAMTNERPYKKPLSKSQAISELREKSGTQFDPNLIELFITKVLKVN